MNGTVEEEDDLTSEEGDGTALHERFDTEGISAEEMRYWLQFAPEDQKLAGVEDPPVKESTTPSKSLDQAEP